MSETKERICLNISEFITPLWIFIYVKLQRIISLFLLIDIQLFLWCLPIVKSHWHYLTVPFDFPDFKSRNSESLVRIKLTTIHAYAWYRFYFWLIPYKLSISIVTLNALHTLCNTDNTIHASTDSSNLFTWICYIGQKVL